MKRRAANIAMLEIVAGGLQDLLHRVVFVGGATTAIYLDDEGAPHIRLTDDVDCITQVVGITGFHQLEAQLRALGFKNSTLPGEPLCRWTFQGVKVDVMPDDEKILGFSNKWYKAGIAAAAAYGLPSGTIIRVLSAPYFIATKLEAFNGRGQGDYQASADLEDIIAVLDGRTTIWSEIAATDAAVKEYLLTTFSKFVVHTPFLQSLIGHLPPEPSSPVRAERIVRMMRSLGTSK